MSQCASGGGCAHTRLLKYAGNIVYRIATLGGLVAFAVNCTVESPYSVSNSSDAPWQRLSFVIRGSDDSYRSMVHCVRVCAIGEAAPSHASCGSVRSGLCQKIWR